MAKDDLPEPKRRNRTMNIADVLAGALDPVLKKRGFASRDIIAHWSVMAPKPYGEVAIPDKLNWPRGERSEEGATLVLRCIPGHALAIAHDGPKIAAAVNRYFGFVLVSTVRLSAEAFTPGSGEKSPKSIQPSQSVAAKVGAQVAEIADDDLREALRTLGHALSSRSERKGG
ncbi:DUF721 domain-containing protein [Devosia psychrophila]|jgi:hypothetical protein|uniref:DUF721 domain-containing protein n=1 Tax=Devosia psychrophila TaxID=728005 RepID=A0A0F5PV40_9HYPH|nr:DciA family protein [Devosia psychrophila]KKC32490.1 hypothetical protein WH91_13630 [Devosia psychrophila]SFD06824.1 hypothetical protein SAMN04488059_11975 [Devosia psychrophila]